MSSPTDDEIRLRLELENLLSGPAHLAEESLRRLGEQARQEEPKVRRLEDSTRDLARAELELALANRAVADSANGSAEDQLKAMRRLTQAQRDFNDAQRRVRQEQRRIEEENARSHRSMRQRLDDLTQRMNRFGRAMSLGLRFTHILRLIKFTAIIAAIGLLGGAIAALGAAGFAAISGLAPLSALLIAYPGYGLAAAQGIGVFRAAISGISDAVTVLSDPTSSIEDQIEALKDLPPAAQQAALAFTDLKKNGLDPLRRDLQQEFWSQINLGGLKEMLGDFTPILRDTANVIGRIVNKGLDMMKSGPFSDDLKNVMAGNNRIIEIMGDALLTVADSFVHVLSVARPFLEWLSGRLRDGAENMNRWVRSTEGTQKIINFFYNASKVISGTYQTVKNFFLGFVALAKPASGLAGDLGDKVKRLSERFREWAQSAKGQEAATKFFEQIRKVLEPLGRILTGLLSIFGKLSGSIDFEEFATKVADKLVPALAKLFEGVNGGKLADAIIDIAVAFIELAGALNTDGTLGEILEQIAGALSALAKWVSDLPEPLKKMIGWMILLGIGTSMASGFISNMIPILQGLSVVLTNPYILAAIAGFMAGFLIGKLIIDHWEDIKKFFGTLGNVFQNIGNFISDIFSNVADSIGDFFEKVGDVIGTVKDGIVSAAKFIWEIFKWLGDKIDWIYDHTIGPVVGVVKSIGSAIGGAWNSLFGSDDDGGKKANFSGDNSLSNATNSNRIPGKSKEAGKDRAPGNSTKQKMGGVSGARWAGGAVFADKTYLIGEKGRELFKGRDGKYSLIGDGGPQYMRFDQSGEVIPNHVVDPPRASDRPTSPPPINLGSNGNGERTVRYEGDQYTLVFPNVRNTADFEREVEGIVQRIAARQASRKIDWRGRDRVQYRGEPRKKIVKSGSEDDKK